MGSLMDIFGGDETWTAEDQRYFEKAEAYRARFGKSIPREMMPSSVTDADVIAAIDACLAEDRDVLLERLGFALPGDDVIV